MKTTPLALVYALLGATALASTALGQTSGQNPDPSPATSSSETSRPGTQMQHDPHSDRGRPYGRETSRQDFDEEDENVSGAGRGGKRMEGRPGGLGAGMPMGSAMMQMMREHHAMGARFYLRRGDSALGIRCPAGEPLTNCIDAAGRLLDKLQTIPPKQ